ncbi:MAG: hypothetical protein H6R10_3568 [Rhodocyclaceae bacterium]|nr:hypothetical protein [Rhodocyclaceae bacterium]
MKTLLIHDLSRTENLDAKAMAAVQGGMYKGLPSFWLSRDESKHDSSIKALQEIGQSQDVFNANGNNVAFAEKISSTVNPTQTASNSVTRF